MWDGLLFFQLFWFMFYSAAYKNGYKMLFSAEKAQQTTQKNNTLCERARSAYNIDVHDRFDWLIKGVRSAPATSSSFMRYEQTN